MNNEGFASAKVSENVFRPPPQCRDFGPRQPHGHVLREWPTQIRAFHIGTGDELALPLKGRGHVGPFRLLVVRASAHPALIWPFVSECWTLYLRSKLRKVPHYDG